jgi:hypothetical protein
MTAKKSPQQSLQRGKVRISNTARREEHCKIQRDAWHKQPKEGVLQEEKRYSGFSALS